MKTFARLYTKSVIFSSTTAEILGFFPQNFAKMPSKPLDEPILFI